VDRRVAGRSAEVAVMISPEALATPEARVLTR
jgi:hypothetical protein